MFPGIRQGAVIGLVLLCVLVVLLYAYTYKGIETKIIPAPTPLGESSINLETNTNLEELTKGKTKVLWFNGKQFKRLYEFCTWTPTFECTMMKVPEGRMPIFHQDPKLDPIMKSYLLNDHNEEGPKIRVCMSELEKYPEAMFLDFGANVGVFTLTIAKTLKRKVIAVEPVYQTVVQLCKSIQENRLTDNVTVIFNPLSDQHTQVDMQAPVTRLVSSYVRPLGGQRIQDRGNPTCPQKPSYNTVRLDDLLPYMTSKTAVMKIDVQSSEYNAFKGGQKFLDAIEVPLIFMEWGEVKKVKNVYKFVELMTGRSYVAYSPDGKAVLDNKRYMQWPYDVVWRKKGSV